MIVSPSETYSLLVSVFVAVRAAGHIRLARVPPAA